ncbi:putative phage tail assembly chaperone [Vibrio sp. TRT 1302]|uniref:putative phage tail assembly chaperone n=1 Tax=Vibrio sp. TRT 1302 TaxID=3418504 RepID=UPI003CF56A22
MSNQPTFALKPVVVTVGETDFTFTPTVADANNYSNEVMPSNKVVPAYHYLIRSVEPKQKDELKAYLDAVPGLTMQLFATVSDAAKGGITIALKN